MNLFSSKKISDIHITIFLSLFFFLVSFILFKTKYNIYAEADAYDRALIAWGHSKINMFFDNYGGIWLPLHFTILSISFKLFPFLKTTTEITSLIFSSGIVGLIYIYTKKIFEKEKLSKLIAITAALFIGLNTFRIAISTHALSEPVFIFFLLLSLILLEKKRFTWSIVFLNIAHGIRFESWFLIPIYVLLLFRKDFFKNIDLKKIILLFLIFAFPLHWMRRSWIFNGTPLGFFLQKASIAENAEQVYPVLEWGNLLLSIKIWLLRFYEVTGNVGTIGFLIALYFLIKNENNHKYLFFVIAPIYLYVSLVAQVYFKTMEWFPNRYIFISVVLLTPIISFGIVETLSILNKRKKLFLLFLVITIFILGYFQSFKTVKGFVNQDMYLTWKETGRLKNYLELEKIINSNLDRKFYYVLNEYNQLYNIPLIEWNWMNQIDITKIGTKKPEKKDLEKIFNLVNKRDVIWIVERGSYKRDFFINKDMPSIMGNYDYDIFVNSGSPILEELNSNPKIKN